MDPEQDHRDVPAAVGQRTRLPLVWFVPIIAALLAGWIALRALITHGPTITIAFKDAAGITAEKTKVRYKSVDVGDVKSVTIDPDHRNIQVSVEIAGFARPFLVSDTRFWIVRPRLGGNGVSGLETLVSGAYIDMDVGRSKTTKREFVGLENPPGITGDVPGKEFVLSTPDLGSLSTGAPVYFHHIQVGQISALALDDDGRGITLKVFIYTPYDRFVTQDSRFWHASGVDMSVDSSGIRLLTESITTILLGGVAFEAPTTSNLSAPAAPETRFELAANRDLAMKPPDRVIEPYVLYFDESLRGLTVGSQVDFLGITVGDVTALHAEYDHVKDRFIFPVFINIYPERIRSRDPKAGAYPGHSSHPLVAHMIDRGYRAQLRSANLLTGQLYIAVDNFPRAAKVKPHPELEPMPLPTVRGNLDELQKTIASVANKIDHLPLEKIGRDVDNVLLSFNNTLSSTTTDAPLTNDVHATLTSVGRAADSLRVFTDYLDQHPEALLRGKAKEDK